MGAARWQAPPGSGARRCNLRDARVNTNVTPKKYDVRSAAVSAVRGATGRLHDHGHAPHRSDCPRHEQPRPRRLLPRQQAFRVALSPCRYHPSPRPRRRKPVPWPRIGGPFTQAQNHVARGCEPRADLERALEVAIGQAQLRAAHACRPRGISSGAASPRHPRPHAAQRRTLESHLLAAPSCSSTNSAPRG